MAKFNWFMSGTYSDLGKKIIVSHCHDYALNQFIAIDEEKGIFTETLDFVEDWIPPEQVLHSLDQYLNQESNAKWGGEGQLIPKWEPNFMASQLLKLAWKCYGVEFGLRCASADQLTTVYKLKSCVGAFLKDNDDWTGCLIKNAYKQGMVQKYQYPLALRFQDGTLIPLEFASIKKWSTTIDIRHIFLDKYGHADITVSENGRGNGQMSFDGYSLGWSREEQELPDNLKEFDKCIDFKVRYNIPLSNPGAAPTIIVSLISKKDINLEVVCTSTDPAYLDAPPAKLCLKAGVKNQAKFEPGKVTTHNAVMEEKPKVNESLETFTIDGEYFRRCSSKPTYITPSKFQLIGIKNGGSIFHEITTCGVNPVTEKFHIAVGFAKLTGTEYKLGENYWPIAGFEKEPSDVPYIRNIAHASIDHESEIIDGKPTLIQVATAQINVISNDTKTFNINALIRAFENPNGGPPKLYVQIYNYADDIDGYLDIASNIPYKFFKDGPIRMHLEKGQRFTFEGLE